MPGGPDRPFGDYWAERFDRRRSATEHFVQALLTERKSAKVQHVTKALSSCLKRVEHTLVPICPLADCELTNASVHDNVLYRWIGKLQEVWGHFSEMPALRPSGKSPHWKSVSTSAFELSRSRGGCCGSVISPDF